jgi:hypothetical protein
MTGQQATGHAFECCLLVQVKKGDVGNLPLKLLIDMSSILQPLFREWRARIWSLSFGGRQTATLPRLNAGPSQWSSDSDDDGFREPRVSAEVAAAFARHAGMPHVPSGAPMQMLRDASGAGLVMRVGVSAPVRNAWGAQAAPVHIADTPAADTDSEGAATDLGALRGRTYVNSLRHSPRTGDATASESNGTIASGRVAMQRVSANAWPAAEALAQALAEEEGTAAHSSSARHGGNGGRAHLRRPALLDERFLRQLVPARLTFDALGLRFLGRR